VPDFSGTPPLLLALQGFMYEVGRNATVKPYHLNVKRGISSPLFFLSSSIFAYTILPVEVSLIKDFEILYSRN
jgi:hypothetical protein